MKTFIAIWLCCAGLSVAWLWVMASRLMPATGEAPEDDGADWDAGVRHVCWHCGCHISGPLGGHCVTDEECWDCYCARTAPDDCPAIPNYVQKRKARV